MSCPESRCGESRDSFYGGRFELVQPKGWGFRAGLDALLLAASLPPESGGRAADLGAGAGAAALAAAVRCRGLEVVLVERDPAMADFARRSVALGRNAAIADRLAVIEADVAGKRMDREAAGLRDGDFALVLTNPPFHPPRGRSSPDAHRDAARAVPEAGFLTRWTSVAAALLGQDCLFAMIARPDNLAEILAGAENRLGNLTVLPVHTKAGEAATRILVHARKGSRAPLRLLSGLALRDANNDPLPLERAVGEGTATIDLGLR